jgi:hypothetical protein
MTLPKMTFSSFSELIVDPEGVSGYICMNASYLPMNGSKESRHHASPPLAMHHDP